MADWTGLTDDQKTIANAVYNKITDTDNAVDFDQQELGINDNVLMVTNDLRSGGYKPLTHVTELILADVISDINAFRAEINNRLGYGISVGDSIASLNTRLGNLKFSLTSEGLLHIEEVTA